MTFFIIGMSIIAVLFLVTLILWIISEFKKVYDPCEEYDWECDHCPYHSYIYPNSFDDGYLICLYKEVK